MKKASFQTEWGFGGNVWELNPPMQLLTAITGFEDQRAHQHPSAPKCEIYYIIKRVVWQVPKRKTNQDCNFAQEVGISPPFFERTACKTLLELKRTPRKYRNEFPRNKKAVKVILIRGRPRPFWWYCGGPSIPAPLRRIFWTRPSGHAFRLR